MILKIILIFLTSLWGYFGGAQLFPIPNAPLWGAVAGFAFGLSAILFVKRIEKGTLELIVGGTFGLIIGLVVANLLTYVIFTNSPQLSETMASLGFIVTIVLGYMGVVIGVKKVEEIDVSRFKLFSKGPHRDEEHKILDTSVIIDGRIFEICETGFVDGAIVIPQFVLKELMQIADSSDPLRRTRGRRGLDIVKKIQKQTDVKVVITEQDFPKIREVDHKLVALANKMGCKIITNDVNLNEIAEIQGVTVLNINQLATALRPSVLPGEMMNVYIQKEGKEYGQGIGYLDDGTMVVVKEGRKFIGKNAEVSVTSVLQTTAGRMIFAEINEDSQQQNVHRLR